MADVHTKEQRRRNMQAIKSQSRLEDKVTKALWKKGHRFRKNNKDLFGKPDMAIKKYKIVVFIDSCFWHVCELHSNMPKNNAEFWKKKLNRNIERDKEVTEFYKTNDWNILRVWEHEFKEDFEGTVKMISDFINNKKGDLQ
ncbi:very short patch repair endonuclease [Evansella clarkii]|uniref:very short patch repair endonuclease n=1 Tax=Evansella clarkii TaxID=79879 RepID=UPI000B43E498|nr:very short patch repair endonuclease [Evansella clarkii]